MGNAIVWHDIPVINLDRSIRFYSGILGADVKKEDMPGFSLGMLPHEKDGVGGCLYQSTEDKPSDHGPLIYFNCKGRLDEAIASVERNGGKVLQGKHEIAPYGMRALVLDSEGNRIALHSD